MFISYEKSAFVLLVRIEWKKLQKKKKISVLELQISFSGIIRFWKAGFHLTPLQSNDFPHRKVLKKKMDGFLPVV